MANRFQRWPVATTLVATLALLSFLSLFATPAAAQRSLECQKVWSGADAQNDLLICLQNVDRIQSQWKYYIYPGVAALILIVMIIVLPFVFCCRCCCCRSCCPSCTRTGNPARSRMLLWMWIIIAVIIGSCVCVLIVYGSILMIQTASGTIDEVQTGALGSVNESKNLAMQYFTDFSKTPPTPPPVDLGVFDSVVSDLNGQITTVKDDYFKYLNIARIVAICVGCVGIALVLLILPIACCRCGGCCPVCYSLLFWLFGLLFAILAVIFTVGTYAAAAGCGELNLQYKREPGIFQWYLVPWCDSQFSVSETRNSVRATVAEEVKKGCEELLKYCNNVPAYDPVAQPDMVFVCGKGLTDANQCTTLDFLVEVVSESYVKPDLANTVCTNTTGQVFMERCTVPRCAERCVDITVPNIPARTRSREVWSATTLAANMSVGLSIVYPLLDCNYIMDLVGSAVEEGSDVTTIGFSDNKTVTNCSNLYTSMTMLGSGFFAGAILFLLGIYILHHGSWMWSAWSPKGRDSRN